MIPRHPPCLVAVLSCLMQRLSMPTSRNASRFSFGDVPLFSARTERSASALHCQKASADQLLPEDVRLLDNIHCICLVHCPFTEPKFVLRLTVGCLV